MYRKSTPFLLFLFLYATALLNPPAADAQLPVCPSSGGYIYIHGTGGNIYNWNPALPLSASNPVANTITAPGTGLAVSQNLNAASPALTFYMVQSGNMQYYNGTTWVNTGHSAGTGVNLGAGGGFIYNLEGSSGQVYKYDGTGNATLLVTVAGFSGGGPFDLVGDCAGNFYILRTAAPSWLRKYSPAGVMLQQWTVTGAPDVGSGGGFAIVDNVVYYHNLGGLFSGPLGATTVNFTPIPDANLFPSPGDFASCPMGNAPPVATNDTLFNCVPGTPKAVTASGTAPYSYTVISGTATLTGTGPSYGVTNSQAATVVLHSANNSICGSSQVHDTFLVVPAPVVNAGPDDTLHGCGTYLDTLHGTLSNGTSWITYTYNWTPAGAISSGGATANPVIVPTQDTTFVLTVTTGPDQGGCTVRDSVRIRLKDESVMPDYTFTIKRGCAADTVVFHNTSLQSTANLWDFDDATTDTATHPTHIYPNQDIYTVKLTASNYMCRDSVLKIVDTRHPLAASFTVSDDTVCLGTPVTFTNTSTVTATPGAYTWHFGDGSSATAVSPAHTYTAPGIYNISLITRDAIPCYDTAYHTVVVDSLPDLDLVLSTHDLCTGAQVTATASPQQSGNTGIDWDFGDNYTTSGQLAVSHAYLTEGTWFITATARYRACADVSRRDSVNVHALPVVNLGSDTTLCLDGAPLFVSSLTALPSGSTYYWNTGDTTPVLKIVHDGTYSLTVSTPYDCNTTDDIIVYKDCYIDAPNSFTPNNDGSNDYFFPRQLLSKGVAGFSMQVFNRWGQSVFETTNQNGRGWDGRFNGKDQPAGVYIYIINVVLKNGRTEQKTGNVTLIR